MKSDESQDESSDADQKRGGPVPPTGESMASEASGVPEALAGPAKQLAEQIAAANGVHYSGLLGPSKLLDDAVREALAGPAKQLAEQIAAANGVHYSGLLGPSKLLDDAVREALAGPAKRLAEQVRSSSWGWLSNYSSQALEPSMYANLARALAHDEMVSPDSDYEPDDVAGLCKAPSSTIFERYEIEVKSLPGLLGELDRLTARVAPLQVSWRGQGDADWGLESTLYRAARGPEENRIPSESDLVSAERRLLGDAADRWRLAAAPGVELLARMQHRGVPTRLLDASKNPLIALWFAVSDPREADARLFAMAHRSLPTSQDAHARALEEGLWTGRDPFWFKFASAQERVVGAWGTGTRLREVIPPDYDKRIPAQSAVFLLDGAPALTDSVLANFNKMSNGSWGAAEIAASMSVVLAPGDPRSRIDDTNPLSLVYTFRIPSRLKAKILSALDRAYGVNWESVYPDLEGMRDSLRLMPNWVIQAREELPPAQG